MKKFVEDFQKLLEEYSTRVGEDNVTYVMLVCDEERGYNSMQGNGNDLAQMLARAIMKDRRLFNKTMAFASKLAEQEAKNHDTSLN